ncbi:MAG: ribonuclease [Novosphingobium sp.]|nr:ribonuclease [Novosphingobium sp.]
MPEWLVEQGIGEDRALCINNGRVVAARIDWPGALACGQVENAVLVSRVRGSPRGRARFASGEEALVDRLPADASEGGAIRLEVRRPSISERGRTKLAQARPTSLAPCPAPSLSEALLASGAPVKTVRHFPGHDWEEIWGEAWSGTHDFAGGSLDFSTTPAMTLVDIDGSLAPRALALAAVQPLCEAIRRFDLAGSIGIDFPTLEAKADRKAVDEALDSALGGWPHERTAMNGFGFVQIVARLERPSLLHRIGQHRVGAATRLLLRRAEEIEQPGLLLLTCHPAVKARLKPEWLDELTRRTGRQIRIESDPALAIEAGFAQALSA